jgi:hypothetical protein
MTHAGKTRCYTVKERHTAGRRKLVHPTLACEYTKRLFFSIQRLKHQDRMFKNKNEDNGLDYRRWHSCINGTQNRELRRSHKQVFIHVSVVYCLITCYIAKVGGVGGRGVFPAGVGVPLLAYASPLDISIDTCRQKPIQNHSKLVQSTLQGEICRIHANYYTSSCIGHNYRTRHWEDHRE